MKSHLLPLVLIACCAGPARSQDLVGGRSKTVAAALETALKKKPADVTAADLETLTELSLPHVHIPAFNDTDFAGLSSLKTLRFYSLFHKNQREPNEPVAIGGRVFAKLSSLEELVITSDQLGPLPDDVFAGLTSLKILELTNVTLTRLPKSMLTLPKVEAVYYDGKGMSKEDYATLKEKLGDKLKSSRPK